ncbi:hypothetical protein GGI13_002453 [Coemansia sp. RSA 455]|nr:hypothetical protein GGI14_005774 [Coemansia sp. S680]KAJ2040739.1 hypothetical protein H4S03_000823 [Coemansia sp. S3946]KAJ2050224.1 hypothetical protein H4S04_002736 [Coemansia sp. S16]KAJ2066210.1 hypothetical protein GGI08_001982 [Coemansia sp. S2]KAJ2070170.1 hypothetical protein GGH13_004213 [Coemansia sp. S155-1]KAJ2253893.1 hypothetical protein GGI13_002453 [Coemansia sp. RSA 455]KAJ2342866.1 hypothetical protein GGH92_005188 [Coemansia sp. RSA 2673]
MADNNARVATALDQVEELELALQAAHHLLDKKREVIADQQRIINQQGKTLTERDEKIAQLERTISKQQRTLDEQERTIARSSGHAHRLEHHLRQAVTIAGLIVEAPNGAAADNGAAPRNTNTDDDTRDGAGPDDNDALDDADPNDDYVLDSDDALENGNIQDNNVTQDSADPDDDAAPANQVTDSPPVAKRPRVDRQVRDGSEQVITSVDLLKVASPFTIIDVRVLADLFEVVMCRQLVPTGMGAQHFTEELATLQGFSHWPPRHIRAGLSDLSGLYLLRRSEIGLERLKSNIRHRLGLTGRRKAVVLGPVLCFVLFTLVGIPLELATGVIFERVFKWVTGKSLRSFQIITRTGTRQMELDEVCHLVKTWARNLRDFIVERGIEHSQKVVKECNACYAEACAVSDGSRRDPKLVAAEKMLAKDKHSSNLYLDLDYENELKSLFGCLFATASNGADRHTTERLREIADEVNNQPE